MLQLHMNRIRKCFTLVFAYCVASNFVSAQQPQAAQQAPDAKSKWNLVATEDHGIVSLQLSMGGENFSEKTQEIIAKALESDLEIWLNDLSVNASLSLPQQSQIRLAAKMEFRRLIRDCKSGLAKKLESPINADEADKLREQTRNMQEKIQFAFAHSDSLVAKVFGKMLSKQQFDELARTQMNASLLDLSLFSGSRIQQVYMVEQLLDRSVSKEFREYKPLTDAQKEEVLEFAIQEFRANHREVDYLILADRRMARQFFKSVRFDQLDSLSQEQRWVLSALQARL